VLQVYPEVIPGHRWIRDTLHWWRGPSHLWGPSERLEIHHRVMAPWWRPSKAASN